MLFRDGVDEVLESVSFQNGVQVLQREAYSMVGDTALMYRKAKRD